jgi:hypothetical protein
MSLDISKLENVRTHGGKITARCPACAEAGHDQTRNHLNIRADGRFGCVVYPGGSADAKEHRKRIFALCGDREIKPLAVRPSGLGRLGRVNQSQSAETPLKTGLLGRLGRVFETQLEREREPTHGENHNTDEHQRNDCEKGVLAVLSDQTATPQRPLCERERDLLMRWCGTDDDAIVLEARTLFNATIVGIERSDGRNARMIKACQTEFSW